MILIIGSVRDNFEAADVLVDFVERDHALYAVFASFVIWILIRMERYGADWEPFFFEFVFLPPLSPGYEAVEAGEEVGGSPYFGKALFYGGVRPDVPRSLLMRAEKRPGQTRAI